MTSIDSVDCIVCFEPLKEGDMTLPCAHTFHTTCIGEWFRASNSRTCPMCRRDCTQYVNEREPELDRVIDYLVRSYNDPSSTALGRVTTIILSAGLTAVMTIMMLQHPIQR